LVGAINNQPKNEPDQARPRVLITGAGTGRANNLVRSLRAGGHAIDIAGCHSDRFVLAKSDTDWRFHAPSPSSAAQFVAACRPIIEANAIDLIIPSSDADALALARIERQLACRVFVPPAEIIDLCQDKYLLCQALKARDLPVPETMAIGDHSDVVRAFEKFDHYPMLWCRMRHGMGSKGATKVRDADQAWSWIRYWNEMRGAPITQFTLSEYLPGRDFNVQGLWHKGKAILIKMCERLSYLDGDNRPSGMSSTPAVAKTLCEHEVLDVCELAIKVIAPDACGVFNVDLKQDMNGRARVTEINAGRFAMITNIYDLTGRHNMAQNYVRLALGQLPDVDCARDFAPDHYLVRDYDTHPLVASLEEIASDVNAWPLSDRLPASKKGTRADS
jgi:glutathione synthase/RimK-type ligase-like ATP-grasp enzyme